MCVVIELSAESLTADEANRVASLSSVLSPLTDPPALAIHGCDLLSDDADWDAETWDMSSEGKAVLRDALTLVLGAVSGNVSMTALWHEGERPTVPMQAVTQSEMLELVAAGGVSARSGYRIAQSSSAAIS